MATLVVVGDLRAPSLRRGILQPSRKDLAILSPSSLSLCPIGRSRSKAASPISGRVFRAEFREGERPSSAGVFVGGFVLGGLIVGTLGCVYAPQISKALTGADKKDLMRKLPKFIYDEEKALEKTRKVLTEKIAQLNAAIDEVSSQLHPDEALNGAVITSDEVEAAT